MWKIGLLTLGAWAVLTLKPDQEGVSRAVFADTHVVWAKGASLGFSVAREKPTLRVTSLAVEAYGSWNVTTTQLDVGRAVGHGTREAWLLWTIDSFDGTVDGWTPEEVSSCQGAQDFFLGGPCKLGAEGKATKRFQLPPHRGIRVTARVHFFDDWRGEALSLWLDNKPVWSRQHTWCSHVFAAECRRLGLNVCGAELPDLLSARVETTQEGHSAESVTLEFGSGLAGRDACEASWGVDDVAIYYRPALLLV